MAQSLPQLAVYYLGELRSLNRLRRFAFLGERMHDGLTLPINKGVWDEVGVKVQWLSSHNLHTQQLPQMRDVRSG